VKVPLWTADVSQWWDLIFKPGVKDVTIDYCRRRAQLAKDTRRFYESCLRDLVAEEDPVSNWTTFQELKSSAKQWEESTMRGYSVRSRAPLMGDDELASTFHVKEEKRRA